MKNFILAITMSCLSLNTMAQSYNHITLGQANNQFLIQEKILGQKYCYKDNKTSGWFFSKDGVAVRYGINLGMPGPDDFYKLTFSNSPRSYGSFDLYTTFKKIHFQLDSNDDLIEGSTGKHLTVKTCN